MGLPTDDQLRKSLSRYDAALATRAAYGHQSRELVQLEAWRTAELRPALDRRAEADGAGWLTVDELGRLMDWKLAVRSLCRCRWQDVWLRATSLTACRARLPQRGKWRPRLADLSRTNPPKLVKQVTTDAYPQDPAAALKTLTRLKAVGPATASAILALWRPASQPFLSDEAYAAVGLGKPSYTAGECARFAVAMRTRAGESGWGGVDVLERAMWAWGVEQRHRTGEEDGAGDPRAVELVHKAAAKKEDEMEEDAGGKVEQRVSSKARQAGAKYGGTKRMVEERGAGGEGGVAGEAEVSPSKEEKTGAGPAGRTRSSKRLKKA